MRYTHGDLDSAGAMLLRSLALARDVGDQVIAVWADILLGHVDHAARKFDSAHERYARSLTAFRSNGVPWGVGNALSGLAGVAVASGDIAEAERLLTEAAAVLQHAAPWFMTQVSYFRATLAVQRGDPDEAIAVLRQSLTRIRDLQDKFAFVYAMVALAAAAELKGDDAWAARILAAGDAVTERTGATVADQSVQDIRREVERRVRARLGLERWNLAHAAGRAASIDSLMNDIEMAI
jgi:ATP/maltotriose-dependent transcriptional regulator MalT